MKNSFELLLVKDCGDYWEVKGITYANAMKIMPDCTTLRATLFTIEECKKALAEGKVVTISKTTEYSEVQTHELIIDEKDELTKYKQLALNEVAARIQQSIFAINVIDLMDYLDCYINLLNAGYHITDHNREDKYFEVIEASQEYEEPESLSENATFEDEVKYIEAKQKYDTAQYNLSTLEKYLNAYDNISTVKSKIKIFTDIRKQIEDATTVEDIEALIKIYRSNLQNYGIVNMQ